MSRIKIRGIFAMKDRRKLRPICKSSEKETLK